MNLKIKQILQILIQKDILICSEVTLHFQKNRKNYL